MLLAERVTHGACLMDMWHYKQKKKKNQNKVLYTF